ncbi:DNA-binding protein [Thiohalorhabdus denitrificans]|uniref:Heat shock protein HspQ n=1 Tax=Thiohalorhabdus denitrificans TaxID=381306 RepID=A0A0P9CKF9_9GAMM|nr:heat shock protein HspQ [Thiohalorhabdus denitrificans]KPV39430.1 DNA-binding protein [Thiohalorhabdus denitrificans]SCY03409.1 heat shock protein HspQ [Thiohalorhabdus denitrificans]
MSDDSPRFRVGQLVHHRRFNYRGVIVGVDPEFRGTEAWYQLMATSRPPKDRPWYQVLVHNAGHRTYVAERNLEPDPSGEQIDHPELGQFFKAFSGGRYVPRGEND